MKKIIFILGLLVMNFLGWAQDVNQNQQAVETQANQKEVLDLTREAIRIERRIEMPRVRIFNKRIPPKFDEVAMDRSFLNEIIGKNEEVKLFTEKKIAVKPIKNVKKILNKKR